jgi:transposase
MAKLAVLGIDLGKNVCSVVGLDEARNVVLRRRMKRGGSRLSPSGSPLTS